MKYLPTNNFMSYISTYDVYSLTKLLFTENRWRTLQLKLKKKNSFRSTVANPIVGKR